MTTRQMMMIKSAVTEEWPTSLIIEAWNEYCDRNNSTDRHIYPMAQLEEHIGDKPLREIIDICNNGDIRTDDEYFEYIRGNIVSFSDCKDSECLDIYTLIEYISQSKKYKKRIDKKRLLAEFAYIYDLTDEGATNIVAASNLDIVSDDWDLIYNEGGKTYRELLADNE